MGTRASTNSEPASDIRALDDFEFFRHWSALRQRIALSGTTAPDDLKREYAIASAEYRRRVDGGRDSDGGPCNSR
jgi:hypothetical protein